MLYVTTFMFAVDVFIIIVGMINPDQRRVKGK